MVPNEEHAPQKLNIKRKVGVIDEGKAPKVPKTLAEKDAAVRLIVILAEASLEAVKIGKGKAGSYDLLNCDDHQNILRKANRDIAEVRPDITHQVRYICINSNGIG